jgi:RimJ/RimL family protein N-acetyltransferase
MKLVPCSGRLADYEKMACWDNQEEILPFITVNFVDGTKHQALNAYDMFKHDSQNTKFFIVVDGIEIGYVTYEPNPPQLLIRSDDSVWISICIGERSEWGKGYAKDAMKLLEKEIAGAGFKRIELGVFDYNKRAQALYTSMGYQVFSRLKEFTFYDGKWHDDIRMQKYV